jgi:hypothetical protein
VPPEKHEIKEVQKIGHIERRTHTSDNTNITEHSSSS